MDPHEGTVRWGIAGTGRIAASFAEAFVHSEGGELVAVGSRNDDTAAAFAADHAISRPHGSYEELAADPEVDVVYVAGLHPVHHDHTLLFLEAGKHVLVEKPIALNAAQVDAMVAAAERHDRFLMEAMWMRFNPAHRAALARIEDGTLGEVGRIRADFSFALPFDPDHRLWSREKGGGALLDLGVYPLTLAWWFLGEPDTVAATGHLAPTGVDDRVSLLCGWRNGASATLTAAISIPGEMTARVEGTQGAIVFPAPAHATDRFIVERGGETEEVETAPASLHHQVAEVHRCLAAGARESPAMPWGTSRALMARLDAIRADLGVRYVCD